MITSLFRAAAISVLISASAAPVLAAEVPADIAQSRSITVAQDKSLAFRLDAQVGELVVAQPEIAEIVAKTDHSFYIRGKKLGATNILVYGPDQNLIEVIDVRVGPDADALRADLAAALPNEKINVANVADGFLLSGQVSSTAAYQRAIAVAKRYAPEAVSTNLNVVRPDQVVLEVRIVEASRSALKDFGINLSAMGSDGGLTTGAGLLGVSPAAGAFTVSGLANGVSMEATLRALEDKGVIRTLARPNLTALSGEEASFLAGGEFPFPVPQGRDQVTIEFRPFGVTLKFKPEVTDSGMIRLKVEPEVSQLDDRNNIRINGYDVPSLIVRRAATTVELEPGKSFAIAGLFQQDYVDSIRQTPGLGDVPVLGALFRSERWRKQETELVIIVTPRMADPDAPVTGAGLLDDSAIPATPTMPAIPPADPLPQSLAPLARTAPVPAPVVTAPVVTAPMVTAPAEIAPAEIAPAATAAADPTPVAEAEQAAVPAPLATAVPAPVDIAEIVTDVTPIDWTPPLESRDLKMRAADGPGTIDALLARLGAAEGA